MVTNNCGIFFSGNMVDFDSVRRTVIFGPADTIKTLNISIVDDSIVESQENFTLIIQLSRATVRLGVERGNPSQATVIINDDDSKMQLYK